MKSTSTLDRKLVIVSLGLLIVASGFFGFVLYLQNHPPSTPSKPHTIVKVGKFEVYIPQLAPGERDENIAKAKRLRELLRPWAMEHKTEIGRMLNTQGDDEQALAAVYNVLPSQPRQKGSPVTFENLSAGTDKFTWDVGAEKMKLSPSVLDDPIQRGNHEKTIHFEQDRIHKNYIAYHDIAISQSANLGTTAIKLWASGRITETTLKIENTRLGGGKIFDDAAEQEIIPRYEFVP